MTRAVRLPRPNRGANNPAPTSTTFYDAASTAPSHHETLPSGQWHSLSSPHTSHGQRRKRARRVTEGGRVHPCYTCPQHPFILFCGQPVTRVYATAAPPRSSKPCPFVKAKEQPLPLKNDSQLQGKGKSWEKPEKHCLQNIYKCHPAGWHYATSSSQEKLKSHRMKSSSQSRAESKRFVM